MSRIQKNVIIIVSLLALLLISLFCIKNAEGALEDNTLELDFNVIHNSYRNTITSWYDGENNIYYVFVPSYADLNEIIFQDIINCRIEISGIEIDETTDLSVFSYNKDYDLRITKGKNSESSKINFMHSSNVSTLFVNTFSGSMKKINADKNYEEAVQIELYTPHGDLEYNGKKDSIKGRGDGTWSAEKKPYLLILSEAKDLLGMGAAEKWVLLSNPYDETCIRNKIVYDFASKIGFEWTPRCEFVDLFLNGDYAGLYLLAEKVEIRETRLNIGSDERNFLCRNEQADRLRSLKNGFLTKSGRAVEITAPNVTKDQKKQIISTVQLMEDCILNNNIECYIDLESWARQYLIDEVFGNTDADNNSSYFYCKYINDKPVIFRGPIWDYDRSIGGAYYLSNPMSFIACTPRARTQLRPYNITLYNNSLFYDLIVETYVKDFLPQLELLLDHEITNLAQNVYDAVLMNYARWEDSYRNTRYHNTQDDFSGSILKRFLSERISFLNSAWIQNNDYISVLFETVTGNFVSYAIETGYSFSSFDQYDVIILNNSGWINQDTGEFFDPDKPVTEDAVYLLTQDDLNSPIQFVKQHAYILFFLPVCLIFGIALLTFIIIDRRRYRGK